jgi:hypothetical protein
MSSNKTVDRRALVFAAPALLWLTATAPVVSAQVSTNLSFDASASVLTQTERDEIASHVAEAIRRWSSLLVIDGPRSIEVKVFVTSEPTASASSAVGVPIGQAGGRDLLEQSVAYELRTGIDANGADPDMNLNIGLNYLRNQIWFDPDPAARTATVPNNRVDAMSVFLHEAGHAIAYNGWADNTTGVPPATYWSTFDRWMIPGAPTVFSGPSAVATWGIAPGLTTGNNKHWGNASPGMLAPRVAWQAVRPVEWKNGLPVPPTVPAPPMADAALMRADATDPLIMQLMNGVVFYAGHRYDISPLDIAVLRDVGLPLDKLFVDGFD